MKKTKLGEEFRKLKEEMAPMTFPEKADHIWTYYKEYIIVGAILLLILIIVLSLAFGKRKEVMVSGVVTNISVRQEGMDYLKDGFFATLGGDEEDQEAQLLYLYFKDVADPSSLDTSYNQMMQPIAMVSAGELDYFIMDQMALEFYMYEAVFLDLREFFDEEELENWAPYLVYPEDGVDGGLPIAVDITHFPFVQNMVTSKEDKVYFALSGNSQRPEVCREFWNYLMSWMPEQ